MHLKKWVLVLIVCWFIQLTATAQTSQGTNLSGQIIDKLSGNPVEFANVALLNSRDSSLITLAITDTKGRFAFEKISNGNYLLRASFIGYEKAFTQVLVSGKPKINLGSIAIQYESKPMSAVTVMASKSLLNTSIDRKTYDVTKDIMAQSGSASDVLKNIPSVEVDLDGQVTLRGSSDVMILINGRPSPLMGKMRVAEVLQQLPANSIEKIEVITNPSARYKPDGTSGILNIVMKKNTKNGWNGSITANTGNRDRHNASVLLNYKPGKINIFGNYGIRQDSRLRTGEIDRQYFASGGTSINSYYLENSQSATRPLTHLGTLGVSYDPNKENSFGISANYSNRDMVKNDVINKFFYDNTHKLTSQYDRLRLDPENEKQKDATAFWEHNFTGEDHTIRFELNVSSAKEVEDNHYQNAYHLPFNNVTRDNTLIKQGEDQQQLTIDYSRVLSESAKLEAGYSGSFLQQDFNFLGENYDPSSGKFITDKVKTNRFLFNQTIHSLYGTYQKSFEKFSFSLGLRLEESLIKGNQLTKDTLINNEYLKIYPTLHLAYQLNNGQLQLNYSRRVHRPEGDDINPFPEYQDPYNIRTGNPKLLPEIIHSVEFGYKWQHKDFSFVPSFYYRYKQNGFTQVTLPVNDSVLLTTNQNLSNDQSAGLELIFSAKAKFISANLSSNFFFNQINATNLGYFDKKTILSFSTNFNTTINFTQNTMAQVSANYRSARLTPQGENFPVFVLNIGLRQDLFAKKVSLLLAASDILRSLQERSQLHSGYLYQTSVRRRDAQIVYFGISYRFGKPSKKSEVKMQFDNAN